MRAAVDAARPAGLRLTVSAGVAATQGRHIDAHAVLRRADRALYAAKDAGRNRVMVAERHLVPVGPA
jgi:diguanylate cyclase (GGDEF)-like protein